MVMVLELDKRRVLLATDLEWGVGGHLELHRADVDVE
jgi:hypothetical protein